MCPRLARLGKYLAPGAYPGLPGERAEEAVTIAAGVVDPMLKARDSLITTKLERLKSETELLKAEK